MMTGEIKMKRKKRKKLTNKQKTKAPIFNGCFCYLNHVQCRETTYFRRKTHYHRPWVISLLCSEREQVEQTQYSPLTLNTIFNLRIYQETVIHSQLNLIKQKKNKDY